MLGKKVVMATIAIVTMSMVPAYAQNDTYNSDGYITNSVKNTLSNTRIYRGIRVQTINGVTYIYGTLDTPREVLEAKEIAASAPGVKRIVSSLEYGPN